MSEDAQNPVFALQSGNTFINTIYDTITYSGEKLWTNLPDDYPLVDLPTVTFILDRSIPGGELEKNIASMTIEGDDWQNLNSNGHYEFEFAHTGANVPAISASDLPLPEGEELVAAIRWKWSALYLCLTRGDRLGRHRRRAMPGRMSLI